MKTLKKIKLKVSNSGKTLSIWHWQKTWWVFGYWYRIPFKEVHGVKPFTHEQLRVSGLELTNALHEALTKSTK